MSNKTLVFRLIFWLSFTPYLFLVGYSLYHAIFGYDLYTMILPQYLNTIYGWDAFNRVFIWTAIALCIIPILPICLIYQIICLFIYFINRVSRNLDSKKRR
jgi:hypothetical protein